MKTHHYIAAVDLGGAAVRTAIAGHRCRRARHPARGSVIAPVNLPDWQTTVPAAVDLIEKLVPCTWREAGA